MYFPTVVVCFCRIRSFTNTLDATVMPVLKNPRHERFAQLLASGKTGTDAYEEAGYRRNDGNGPALAGTEELNGRGNGDKWTTT
jgi:hypothetical protein